MTKKGTNRMPVGLATHGKALWKAVTDSFELDPLELEALEHAARQSDLVALLDAQLAAEGISSVGSSGQPRMNGLVAELRQARLAIGKLMTSIRLPPSSADLAGNVPEGRDAVAIEARRLKAQRLGADG